MSSRMSSYSQLTLLTSLKPIITDVHTYPRGTGVLFEPSGNEDDVFSVHPSKVFARLMSQRVCTQTEQTSYIFNLPLNQAVTATKFKKSTIIPAPGLHIFKKISQNMYPETYSFMVLT